jgi:hypothetical protein
LPNTSPSSEVSSRAEKSTDFTKILLGFLFCVRQKVTVYRIYWDFIKPVLCNFFYFRTREIVPVIVYLACCHNKTTTKSSGSRAPRCPRLRTLLAPVSCVQPDQNSHHKIISFALFCFICKLPTATKVTSSQIKLSGQFISWTYQCSEPRRILPGLVLLILSKTLATGPTVSYSGRFAEENAWNIFFSYFSSWPLEQLRPGYRFLHCSTHAVLSVH